MFTEEMRRDPYPMYARLREATPVVHLPAYNVWMVLDHATVKRALHDHDAFSNRVAASRNLSFEWLLFMDPPRHTELRALVNRAFTSRSIAALEPRIHQITCELLDSVGETFDLEHDLAAPLPIRVIGEMIGIPDHARLLRWSHALMDLGATIIGTPDESRAASEAFLRADAEMAEYFAALAAERRRAPADDLLTRLLDLDDTARLRFVQLLIAAGTETTTNLIDNAIVSLLEHPGELAKLRANPALLDSAIEEVLRYRSPAQAMFRTTRQAIELHGQTIPAGAFVLAMIGAANRDPRVFSDPDRLDIARDPNPHVAFGHGIHFCIGAPLSRLEARVVLRELLARFASFEHASDAPWAPRRPFHVHGPASLPIRACRTA